MLAGSGLPAQAQHHLYLDTTLPASLPHAALQRITAPLTKDRSKPATLQLLVSPAWSMAWALFVDVDANGSAILTYHETLMDPSVAERIPAPVTRKVPMSKDLVEKVRLAWSIMLEAPVPAPSDEGLYCLDVDTYFFSMQDAVIGRRSAHIACPTESTRAGQLEIIVDELRRLAQADESGRAAIEGSIKTAVQLLEGMPR